MINSSIFSNKKKKVMRLTPASNLAWSSTRRLSLLAVLGRLWGPSLGTQRGCFCWPTGRSLNYCYHIYTEMFSCSQKPKESIYLSESAVGSTADSLWELENNN